MFSFFTFASFFFLPKGIQVIQEKHESETLRPTEAAKKDRRLPLAPLWPVFMPWNRWTIFWRKEMAFSYYYILSLLRAVIWMMRWHENKPMIYLLYKPCSSNIAERAVFLLHFWAIGFCRYFLVTENFVFFRALFSFLVFLSLCVLDSLFLSLNYFILFSG